MSKYRNESNITELIIHCSATPNGKDFNAKDIDNWHKERGFKRGDAFIGRDEYKLRHIGYHFVICLDGTVELGRRIDEVGAHAKGHNVISIGICMIGTDKFTNEQWVSLGNQIRALINVNHNLKIIGHNEISGKTCPCFDVKQYIEDGMIPLADNIL